MNRTDVLKAKRAAQQVALAANQLSVPNQDDNHDAEGFALTTSHPDPRVKVSFPPGIRLTRIGG